MCAKFPHLSSKKFIKFLFILIYYFYLNYIKLFNNFLINKAKKSVGSVRRRLCGAANLYRFFRVHYLLKSGKLYKQTVAQLITAL